MTAKAETLLRKYHAMKADRSRVEPFYVCASQFFDPLSYRLWTAQGTAGNDWNWNDNFSGVGIRAKNRFANFMAGNATPMSARWLVLQDEQIPADEQDADAAQYWADATRIIADDLQGGAVLPGSFYKAKVKEYADMTISYGVVYVHDIEVDGEKTGQVGYRSVSPQHFYYQLDTYDQMTCCALVHEMTEAEAQSLFQRSVIDAENAEERANKSTDRKTIVQIVERNPRPRAIPRNFDEFAFTEYWIDLSDPRILRTKGYYSQPFHVMGWYRVPNSSYMLGPAYDALPDMIGASAARRALIKAMEMVAQPPLLGGEKIQGALKTLAPGRVTWNARTANGMNKVAPLEGLANPGALFSQVADDEQRVSNALFEFDMNLPGTSNMSATEVAERASQRAAMVAPFAVHTMPSIKGQIARHYEIKARAGGLPNLPPAVAERGRFGVEMVGPLALAARQAETVAMLQTMDQIAMIEGLPSQMIDKREAAQLVARQGGYAHILRSKKDVEEAERAQAMLAQQQTQAEIGKTEAEAAKAEAEALNGIVA